MKILIIDNDKTMPLLLAKLLAIEGDEGFVFKEDSLEGLFTELEKNNYDLVLMDVFLDSFNGINAIKQIKSNVKLNKLPVLMTSGMDLRNECMLAGASDFLLKPFMPDELLAKIRLFGKKHE